jgi:hypothetical protein
MRRYIEHIKAKEPHHRRQHAVQVAGVLTAVAFVVWITTLPLRFGGTGAVAQTGGENADTQQTQLAGAGAADTSTDGTNDSGLQVVGTSTDGSAFSNY